MTPDPRRAPAHYDRQVQECLRARPDEAEDMVHEAEATVAAYVGLRVYRTREARRAVRRG